MGSLLHVSRLYSRRASSLARCSVRRRCRDDERGVSLRLRGEYKEGEYDLGVRGRLARLGAARSSAARDGLKHRVSSGR